MLTAFPSLFHFGLVLVRLAQGKPKWMIQQISHAIRKTRYIHTNPQEYTTLKV